jgi:hypothetical protein
MFEKAKDPSAPKLKWRQSILVLSILLLVGVSVYVGHRYYTIYRLTSSGVDFADWVGGAVSLERKVLRREGEGVYGYGQVPLTAGLPGCYPREAKVSSLGIGTAFSDAYSLGRAIRSVGEVERLFLFLGSDYEGFFDGLGHNDRLTYIYSGWDHNFNDNALERLAQFPNLQEIDLWPPGFKGSGLPALGKLQRFVIGESSADQSLLDALLNCPELREIDVDSVKMDLSKAKLLTRLPKIEEIQISNAVTEEEFKWQR